MAGMSIVEELNGHIERCPTNRGQFSWDRDSLLGYLDDIVFPRLASYNKFFLQINRLPADHSLRGDEHVVAMANDQQQLIEATHRAARILERTI
jgi:hypothetical protein